MIFLILRRSCQLYMLKDDESRGDVNNYNWTCPRKNCRKYIFSVTERGLKLSRETHEDMHWKEDKERIAEAIANFEKRGVKPPEFYNKLVLSLRDINMFEQYKIQIDEDCIIDGYSCEFK